MRRLVPIVVLVLGLSACTDETPPAAVEPASEAVADEGPDAEPSDAADEGPYDVPDVTGLAYPDARAELLELGADVRREVVSSPDEINLVLEQRPAAGTTVDVGDPVVLTVSDGRGEAEEADEPAVAPSAPPVTASRAPVRTPVYELPSGLFCRDLHARGYSYPEAVWYWDLAGRPDRMDASGNGIPCQTVYDSGAVSSYWNDLEPVYALPSGLFCRDLHARGYSYAEAVWYWELEGWPDRMDASGNGIPCQTVYGASAVASYWQP